MQRGFGRFQFDLATGELRRDGVRITLQPALEKLLAHLVSRGGETVSRADLAQQFLSSAEYRGLAVNEDYARLLQRTTPPAAGEVAYWVGSGLDLLTLDALFASTPEFQQNG